MDFDEAVEALVQANTEGDAPSEGSALDAGLEQQVNPLLNEQARESESTATREQPPAQETPQAPETEDSLIERADLEALLEGIEDPAVAERITRAYKSFQGAFTRRSQEVAPWRKLSEQGIDPETAAQAAQWYAAMSDPNVALQFHQHLESQLAAAGLLDGDQPAGLDPYSDEYDEALEGPEFDLDPDNPLVQHVQYLNEAVQRLAMERQAERYADEIRHAETRIREANPHFTQKDLDRIASMALNIDASPGQAMIQAAQDYQSWRDEIISGFIETKGSVQVGGNLPTGQHAQEPLSADAFIKDDGEIDFSTLEKAALERYAQDNAA